MSVGRVSVAHRGSPWIVGPGKRPLTVIVSRTTPSALHGRRSTTQSYSSRRDGRDSPCGLACSGVQLLCPPRCLLQDQSSNVRAHSSTAAAAGREPFLIIAAARGKQRG